MHAIEAAASRSAAVKQDAGVYSATRIVVSTFGALVAFAGIEHGIGEILQGPVAPGGLAIASWPHVKAFDILAGEPAMTVIPNLLVTGVLAVIVALALGIWSVMFIERRGGGPVLIALSVLLLLVGGGVAPALMGIILGIAATRIGAVSRRQPGGVARAMGRVWPWALGAGVLGYLGLFPGLVVASWLFGVSDPNLVLGLSALSFAALLLAPAAARAQDRAQAADRSGRDATEARRVAGPSFESAARWSLVGTDEVEYMVASAERTGIGVIASFDRSIDRVATVRREEPG